MMALKQTNYHLISVSLIRVNVTLVPLIDVSPPSSPLARHIVVLLSNSLHPIIRCPEQPASFSSHYLELLILIE